MDNSETRRGQPCWYKVDDVKLTAINDALMIESCIYYILKKYFSHTSSYMKLMELFHETMLITTIGQSLDLQTANKDVECFTMDRYNSIVTHKTAYYTFYLPVALAMHLADYEDPEVFRQVKTILLEMGQFFQVRICNSYSDPRCLNQNYNKFNRFFNFFRFKTISWIVLVIQR